MTPLMETGEEATDVVFPLAGQALPREHAQALRQALCAVLPWLETDPVAGVHPVKLVPGSAVPALLSRRARLLLRVASRRMDALMALTGLELNVAGHSLCLGVPHRHELAPHRTLYAYRVAADSADEVAFMAAVAEELAGMAIGGERVCGKHQTLVVDGRPMDTFSLMLHALPTEQSLRLQRGGLRTHRLLGCGLFVPHRSAAAVGA